MIRLEKLGYFTASEAMEHLNMPRATFYRMIKQNKLPKPILEQVGMTIWKKRDIVKMSKHG